MCYTEAMACGVPVIYPAYATPTEYIKNEYPVKTNPCNYGKFGANLTWVDVNIYEMVRQMLKVEKKKNDVSLDFIKQIDWKNLKPKWHKIFKECLNKDTKIGGMI